MRLWMSPTPRITLLLQVVKDRGVVFKNIFQLEGTLLAWQGRKTTIFPHCQIVILFEIGLLLVEAV